MSKKATNDNTLREIFPQAPTGDKELDSLFMGAYIATHRALKIALDAIHSGEDVAPVKDAIINRTGSDFVPLSLIETKNGSQVVAIGKQAELDPTNPAYDPQAYKAKLQELAPELEKAADKMSAYTREIVHNFADAMPEEMTELSQGLTANLPQMLANLTEWVKQNLQGVEWDLIPYITAEMEKPENKALLEQYGTIGALVKAPEWQAILKAARQAKAEEENKTLPTLDGEKLKGINYPISKVNKEVWDKARDEVSGQYKLSIDTTPNADPVQVSVNMDALPPEVLRNLSHYDRRVWTAAVSLWVQGCRVVSAANIFYAMGNNSKPNPAQIEKIDKAMYKMGATYIQIDNMNEAASTNYDLFFRDKFYLLKVEGTSAINPANGQVINSAYILPEDEPKLLTFAKMRGQVTTINRAVYAAPISQSENGLKLHDFLIDRIITMKREPKYSRKINLATVCEYMGTAAKHKDRLKEQIINLLNYFADPNGGNFIAGWRCTTKAEERKEPAGFYIELKAEALPDNSNGKK